MTEYQYLNHAQYWGTLVIYHRLRGGMQANLFRKGPRLMSSWTSGSPPSIQMLSPSHRTNLCSRWFSNIFSFMIHMYIFRCFSNIFLLTKRLWSNAGRFIRITRISFKDTLLERTSSLEEMMSVWQTWCWWWPCSRQHWQDVIMMSFTNILPGSDNEQIPASLMNWTFKLKVRRKIISALWQQLLQCLNIISGIAAGLRRLVAIPNGGSGQNVGLISF